MEEGGIVLNHLNHFYDLVELLQNRTGRRSSIGIVLQHRSREIYQFWYLAPCKLRSTQAMLI
jgi:hypothetical protein